MSEQLICDCCGVLIKTKPTVFTCQKCGPAERQFNQYVNDKLAALQEELNESKLEWMRSRGAATQSPPGAASGPTPSQPEKKAGKRSKGQGEATLN